MNATADRRVERPLDHAVETIRSFLLSGRINEDGVAVVQSNIALSYRTFPVHSRTFWGLIENTLIVGAGDVPRPDVVEKVAVEIERQCRDGFDDVATYLETGEIPS